MRAELRQAELAALLQLSQRTIHMSEFVFHCYSYLIRQEVSHYEQHLE